MPLHLAMFQMASFKRAEIIYLRVFKGSYAVQLRQNLYHFFPEQEEGSCKGLKGRCCPASTHLYTATCCTKRPCCGDTASQHLQRSWVVSALTSTGRVKVSYSFTECSPSLAEWGAEGPGPTQ